MVGNSGIAFSPLHYKDRTDFLHETFAPLLSRPQPPQLGEKPSRQALSSPGPSASAHVKTQHG